MRIRHDHICWGRWGSGNRGGKDASGRDARLAQASVTDSAKTNAKLRGGGGCRGGSSVALNLLRWLPSNRRFRRGLSTLSEDSLKVSGDWEISAGDHCHLRGENSNGRGSDQRWLPSS